MKFTKAFEECCKDILKCQALGALIPWSSDIYRELSAEKGFPCNVYATQDGCGVELRASLWRLVKSKGMLLDHHGNLYSISDDGLRLRVICFEDSAEFVRDLHQKNGHPDRWTLSEKYISQQYDGIMPEVISQVVEDCPKCNIDQGTTASPVPLCEPGSDAFVELRRLVTRLLVSLLSDRKQRLAILRDVTYIMESAVASLADGYRLAQVTVSCVTDTAVVSLDDLMRGDHISPGRERAPPRSDSARSGPPLGEADTLGRIQGTAGHAGLEGRTLNSPGSGHPHRSETQILRLNNSHILTQTGEESLLVSETCSPRLTGREGPNIKPDIESSDQPQEQSVPLSDHSTGPDSEVSLSQSPRELGRVVWVEKVKPDPQERPPGSLPDPPGLLPDPPCPCCLSCEQGVKGEKADTLEDITTQHLNYENRDTTSQRQLTNSNTPTHKVNDENRPACLTNGGGIHSARCDRDRETECVKVPQYKSTATQCENGTRSKYKKRTIVKKTTGICDKNNKTPRNALSKGSKSLTSSSCVIRYSEYYCFLCEVQGRSSQPHADHRRLMEHIQQSHLEVIQNFQHTVCPLCEVSFSFSVTMATDQLASVYFLHLVQQHQRPLPKYISSVVCNHDDCCAILLTSEELQKHLKDNHKASSKDKVGRKLPSEGGKPRKRVRREVRLPCPLCPLQFERQPVLEQHMYIEHHSNPKHLPELNCTKCQFMCINMSSLLAHDIRTHRQPRTEATEVVTSADKAKTDPTKDSVSESPVTQKKKKNPSTAQKLALTPTFLQFREFRCFLCEFAGKAAPPFDSEAALYQHVSCSHLVSRLTYHELPCPQCEVTLRQMVGTGCRGLLLQAMKHVLGCHDWQIPGYVVPVRCTHPGCGYQSTDHKTVRIHSQIHAAKPVTEDVASLDV